MSRRVWKRWLFILLLLVIVITPALALLGIIRYYETVVRPAAVYTAALPGPDCDPGWGRWMVGNRHTEDQRDVFDPSTVLVCRPNGLLVTRKSAYAVSGDVHFYGTDLWKSDLGHSYQFPPDYRVSVRAAIVQGSDTTSVNLHVRWPQSYGGYSFEARANGIWLIWRYDRYGHPDKRLALGFLPQPTKQFTLAVEVHRNAMIYALNGVQLAQVSDSTYDSTTSLSFGVADSEAPPDTASDKAPSALFSHFVYTPLAPTKAAQSSVQEPHPPSGPYAAKVPGAGCDQGKAQWTPPAALPDKTLAMTCQPAALRLSRNVTAAQLAEEAFYWFDGQFPPDYRVDVRIDVSRLNNGCAGVVTRADALDQKGGYGFLICQGGIWELDRYEAGKTSNLASGKVRLKGSYLLSATSRGTQQQLALDGAQVTSVEDATFAGTGDISLAIATPQGPGSADFSDFVINPQVEKSNAQITGSGRTIPGLYRT
ncbi:MAG: hypothetical protein IMW89_20070 [Ktedonobacteraceae bacterium]|nr:hypothetical protein [Ktedonobacteraceae bacterium]